MAARFGIGKLHRHTHLYTSDTLQEDFPGRIFQLQGICKYDKKELHRYLPEGKANIAVRNFPDGVAQIRKKTGIREGGNHYVFAATDKNERKIMLITTKWSKGQ